MKIKFIHLKLMIVTSPQPTPFYLAQNRFSLSGQFIVLWKQKIGQFEEVFLI